MAPAAPQGSAGGGCSETLPTPQSGGRNARDQTLLSDVINSLQQGEGTVEQLFADEHWQRVRSLGCSALQQSWVSILNKNGFPCRLEVDQGWHIDLVVYLVEIGQYAGAMRHQMLCLTLWLATSIRSSRHDDVAMVPADGPLT